MSYDIAEEIIFAYLGFSPNHRFIDCITPEMNLSNVCLATGNPPQKIVQKTIHSLSPRVSLLQFHRAVTFLDAHAEPLLLAGLAKGSDEVAHWVMAHFFPGHKVLEIEKFWKSPMLPQNWRSVPRCLGAVVGCKKRKRQAILWASDANIRRYERLLSRKPRLRHFLRGRYRKWKRKEEEIREFSYVLEKCWELVQ